MRMTRVYSPVELKIGGTIELDNHLKQHLITVLKLKPNDFFIVFNGRGGEYQAKLKDVTKKTAIAEIINYQDVDRESPLFTRLFLSLSKGDRMDYAIQKSVELGVNEIVPLVTQFCNVKIDPQRLQKRRNHWQGVSISATEQSGRTRITEIKPIQELFKLNLGSITNQGVAFVLHPGKKDINYAEGLQLLKKCTETSIVIGPEGGLSEAELTHLQVHGFKPLRLGPRILRTETAPVAALSILQLFAGDLP